MAPLYVWVFGVVCWLTWGNLDDQLCASIFPASTLHWLNGASCLASVHVCAQGGRWFPHLRREPRASRPTVTCLEQSALPLPGLETTTARSCHQSADVVGEIYTETLKKQKD